MLIDLQIIDYKKREAGAIGLLWAQGWANNGNHTKTKMSIHTTGTHTVTPDRQQSKTLILSTNIDQKSLGIEFLIVICRPTGDKRQ